MMAGIEKRILDLPPEQRVEVEDFIEFLLSRQNPKVLSKPAFRWAGCLEDSDQPCSSVELQHKISGWRVAEE